MKQQPSVASIEILDITGQIVYHSENMRNSNSIIDIKMLHSGVYFLKTYTNTCVNTVKFVKE